MRCEAGASNSEVIGVASRSGWFRAPPHARLSICCAWFIKPAFYVVSKLRDRVVAHLTRGTGVFVEEGDGSEDHRNSSASCSFVVGWPWFKTLASCCTRVPTVSTAHSSLVSSYLMIRVNAGESQYRSSSST